MSGSAYMLQDLLAKTFVVIVFMLSSFFLLSEKCFCESLKPIRYVAIGDSYTVGTGARTDESWPAVITQRLKNKGVLIELEANLGRNGWTTQNLMDYELPELEKLHPDLVTILIGANDWVREVDSETFQMHMREIFNRLVKIVPDPSRILVITIPDFSVMSSGMDYSNGRDISKGIAEFNGIILKEAETHQLTVIDLYPLSQTMGKDLSLSASDGLHPSGKGYALWADVIEPAFDNLNL